MVLGAPGPDPGEVPLVGDELPEHVATMPILGALLYADLTLQPLVDQAVARLISKSFVFLATLWTLA